MSINKKPPAPASDAAVGDSVRITAGGIYANKLGSVVGFNDRGEPLVRIDGIPGNTPWFRQSELEVLALAAKLRRAA